MQKLTRMLTAVSIIIKAFGSYINVTQVLEGKIYTVVHPENRGVLGTK